MQNTQADAADLRAEGVNAPASLSNAHAWWEGRRRRRQNSEGAEEAEEDEELRRSLEAYLGVLEVRGGVLNGGEGGYPHSLNVC